MHDAYNEAVDAEHENMVWTHPGMKTYYRNDRGRVVVNSRTATSTCSSAPATPTCRSS